MKLVANVCITPAPTGFVENVEKQGKKKRAFGRCSHLRCRRAPPMMANLYQGMARCSGVICLPHLNHWNDVGRKLKEKAAIEGGQKSDSEKIN
jgi:hypothetical protein